jgi:hypothetical protein
MTHSTPNLRLRTLLDSYEHSRAWFAGELGVDPKTVERWITTGRNPYPRLAHKAARLLGAQVCDLWPTLYGSRHPGQCEQSNDEPLGLAAAELEAVLQRLGELHAEMNTLTERVTNAAALLRQADPAPAREYTTRPLQAVR